MKVSPCGWLIIMMVVTTKMMKVMMEMRMCELKRKINSYNVGNKNNDSLTRTTRALQLLIPLLQTRKAILRVK